jgi:hypothetical protein
VFVPSNPDAPPEDLWGDDMQEELFSDASSVAESFASYIQTSEPRRKSMTVGKAARERAKTETVGMIESRDWDSANARHLVCLYGWLHARVYGIEAVELDNSSLFAKAQHSAQVLLAKHFDDDIAECVSFIRWVWTRERGRENWRRENGVSSSRIGVFLQFKPAMVTEYRIEKARKLARS